MTTSPITSITDDLLERLAYDIKMEWGYAYPDRHKVDLFNALLAERAELKRDAERYRFLRQQDVNARCRGEPFVATYIVAASHWTHEHCDSRIDEAMQEAKP